MKKTIGTDNIVHWSKAGEREINGPFLAFYNERASDFSDWMLGIGGSDEEYGNFTPKNLMQIALKTERPSFDFFSIVKDIESFLKKELIKEKRKEQEFYLACGVTNFKDFQNKLNQLKYTSKKDDTEYWVSYFLDCLVGEKMRLATSLKLTDLNKFLSLVKVSMDISGNPIQIDFFSSLKEDFRERGLIKEIQKEKKNAKGETKYYTYDTMVKGALEEIYEVTYNKLITAYGDIMANKITENIGGKSNFKTSMRQSINGTGKGFFVDISGKQVVDIEKKDSLDIEETAKTLNSAMWNFFERVLAVDKQTKKDEMGILEAWRSYSSKDKIKRIFLDTWKDYLKTFSTLSKFFQTSNLIQGNFGEYFTHMLGTRYISKMVKDSGNEMEVFNTGSLKNLLNKQLAYDTIIQIKRNGKIINYGIQTKNPYELSNPEEGVHYTYQDTYSLAQERLYSNYLSDDRNGSVDEKFKKCFQHLNLNVNNTSHPEEFRAAIKAFFAKYLPNFWRLQVEQMRDQDLSLFLKSDELKERFEEGNTSIASAQNIFFIVKGELIPTSMIIEGLLKQAQTLGQAIAQLQKDELFIYKNDIPRNESKTQNLDNVKPLETNTNLLSQVTFETKLKITLPPILQK